MLRMEADMTITMKGVTRDHRQMWYEVVQKVRRGLEHRLDNSELGDRAAMYERIDEATRDGKVSINVDQMDCDCVRWTEGRVMDACPRRSVEQYVQRIYNDAEGPIYGLWFSEPEQKAEYVSRDLAMEAFEDGHPHSVSMARYDEDGHY